MATTDDRPGDEGTTDAGTTAKGLDARTRVSGWTFLTNHAHVLLAIARNPEMRQREIGDLVGITEGATQRILNELEDCGYIERERIGRRNRYSVIKGAPLRHPMEITHSVGELLELLSPTD